MTLTEIMGVVVFFAVYGLLIWALFRFYFDKKKDKVSPEVEELVKRFEKRCDGEEERKGEKS